MKNKDITTWLLRIAVFGTFLGHGVLALLIKKSWIPYLNFVGFSESTSLVLLPLIGLLDITVAISVLIKPNKVVLIWATFWAFTTALIRPISGESIWDFVERTANWATPLALFYIIKNSNKREIRK